MKLIFIEAIRSVMDFRYLDSDEFAVAMDLIER